MDRNKIIKKIQKNSNNVRVLALTKKLLSEESVSNIGMLSNDSLRKIIKVI